MPIQLRASDVDTLEDILANIAANTPGLTPQQFFRNLVGVSGLPQNWVNQLAGVWTGNAPVDARSLVQFAAARDVNPANPRFTTLGSLLQELLKRDLGLESASIVAASIVAYRLYRDPNLLNELVIRYQVPQAPPALAPAAPIVGPDIQWQGPADDLQLQSWLTPEPDFQDVGFLKLAIEQAASVCRIDVPSRKRQGTGVLIQPNLVLTNYHVLKDAPSEDIDHNARDVILHFGYFTKAGNQPVDGQPFKLASGQPILKSSPVDKLDYVLLQVDDAIYGAQDIRPVSYDLSLPQLRTGMNILQHPKGEPLKLAASSNGVTGVYTDSGLVQYVTRALGGSSGSPCFNDGWKMVALHHAERAQVFGSIREGILFSAIYADIKEFMSS